MAKRKAIIHRSGMVTAIGLGSAQTFSSVKAGVAGFGESSVLDSRFEPIIMATMPEEVLPELSAENKKLSGLTSLQRRLLRLATPVFEEVLSDLGPPGFTDQIPLFLATPEKHPELVDPVGSEFLDQLVTQIGTLGLSFNRRQSVILPSGRAGGLVAVDQALEFLTAGHGDYALAGGVDSFLDLMHLAHLDRDCRIQNSQVMDGFIPGEGAGLLLLSRLDAPTIPGLQSLANLVGVGLAVEQGHRYSEEPYQGDGLADAFRKLLTLPGSLRTPVPTIFAGLNGENFGAKEFGVAKLRSHKELLPDAVVMHPVDCFGDIGAALGPIMVGLVAMGIQDATYAAPGLVWCSSDGMERAAALVDILAG